MNSLTANRVIKSGFTNFFRNIWVSIAATSMVAITLFIISTIIIIYTLAVLSIDNSKDKVGVVTAYFNYTTTDQEMANVKTEVEGLPGIKSVAFTSSAEAEKNFREIHKNQPSWIQSLGELDRPVPASLSIKAMDLNNYSSIYTTLKNERFGPYFQKVSDTQIVIDKLKKIIDFITKFGAVLAGIFIVVTIMVTFNTIRLTIYNRKDEVEIMRLVGATNWYIRWPFIIEGIMYAVFATLITSLLIFGLLYLLSNRIEQFLSLNALGTSLIRALFWRIFLINTISSIGLSIVASSIAIRRYLRV